MTVIKSYDDMWARKAPYRVNTVNCQGVMGAGVAAEFKRLYPEMFKDYERACTAGEVAIGRLHVFVTAETTIINLPTKTEWRKASSMDYVTEGLTALAEYLRPLGGVKVLLPALGCGNGGLDWRLVEPVVFNHLDELDAIVYSYPPTGWYA